MAKLAFSKLGLKVNNQVVNISYNDNDIEIKQYLPINDKLKLISDVINNSIYGSIRIRFLIYSIVIIIYLLSFYFLLNNQNSE